MPSRSPVTARGGKPPVGERGRDEEHGQELSEWRRRTLPGQPVLGHDGQLIFAI